MIKFLEQLLKENNISFDLKSTGRKDWDDILKKNQGKFNQIIIKMTPDEFLEKVQYDRFTIDSSKVDKYFEEFKKGITKIPTPTLWFQDRGQYDEGFSPTWHDGSHRVLALKKMGIEKIPIRVIY